MRTTVCIVTVFRGRLQFARANRGARRLRSDIGPMSLDVFATVYLERSRTAEALYHGLQRIECRLSLRQITGAFVAETRALVCFVSDHHSR